MEATNLSSGIEGVGYRQVVSIQGEQHMRTDGLVTCFAVGGFFPRLPVTFLTHFDQPHSRQLLKYIEEMVKRERLKQEAGFLALFSAHSDFWGAYSDWEMLTQRYETDVNIFRQKLERLFPNSRIHLLKYRGMGFSDEGFAGINSISKVYYTNYEATTF